MKHSYDVRQRRNTVAKLTEAYLDFDPRNLSNAAWNHEKHHRCSVPAISSRSFLNRDVRKRNYAHKSSTVSNNHDNTKRDRDIPKVVIDAPVATEIRLETQKAQNSNSDYIKERASSIVLDSDDEETVSKIIESNLTNTNAITSEKQHEDAANSILGPQAIVFNKGLYKSQTAVIITEEASKVMQRSATRLCLRDNIESSRNHNSDYNEGPLEFNDGRLTKSDMLVMRSVVEGLKLIHKNMDYVRDCLSYVVTEEKYPPQTFVPKQQYENEFSCYYVISGSLDVVYGDRSSQEHDAINVYRANIIYSHRSGEYVGIVSPEGPADDLAPPLTIYTKETCHLLRIDRNAFHNLIQKTRDALDYEKRRFISSGVSFLSEISSDTREKVIYLLLKQTFPANHTISQQGATSDYMYVVIKGRCVATRKIHVPETSSELTFQLKHFDEGSFFGEECLLNNEPNVCTVKSATVVECYKLPRAAFEVVNRDQLRKYVELRRNTYLQDDALCTRGYRKSVWNMYKRSLVVSYLRSTGNEKLVRSGNCESVCLRPDKKAYARENFCRFLDKGSQMLPVKCKTSVVVPRSKGTQNRPKTAPSSAPEWQQAGRQTSVVTESKKLLSPNSPIYETRNGGLSTGKSIPIIAWQNEGIGDRSFMDNGVLVTMESDDIVKKAKALAHTSVEKVRDVDRLQTETSETSILNEHIHAKTMIAACKLRSVVLSRKLMRLDMTRPEERRKSHAYDRVTDLQNAEHVLAKKQRPVTAIGLQTTWA